MSPPSTNGQLSAGTSAAQESGATEFFERPPPPSRLHCSSARVARLEEVRWRRRESNTRKIPQCVEGQCVCNPGDRLRRAQRTGATRRGEALAGWRRLLEDVFAAWIEHLEVELPLSPRALTALVVNVFQGAEVEILAGVSEEEAPHLEALEACAVLIERAEQPYRSALAPATSRTPRAN
jgi:hypothetical protein